MELVEASIALPEQESATRPCVGHEPDHRADGEQQNERRYVPTASHENSQQIHDSGDSG
jgi:hypothetical protein